MAIDLCSRKSLALQGGPRFSSCCHEVQTDQSTCLERLRRNTGFKLHCLRKSNGLLLNEEQKKKGHSFFFFFFFFFIRRVKMVA